MLKWGVRILAVFILLLMFFMPVYSRPNVTVSLLFYPLVFSGLLSFNLLVVGVVKAFWKTVNPYLLFSVTAVLVCLGLCIYGYYDIATDPSDFLPGLWGIFVIFFSLLFHFIFLVGAGLHYYFVERKRQVKS